MTKALIRIIIGIIIILIIGVVLVKVIKIQDVFLKRIYPKQYEQYVHGNAVDYGVDPLLIYSIIKAESNFNEKAVSKSNAKGLMQLMDKTAEEIAKKLDMEFSEERLFDPEINIKLGTKYYADLYIKYNNVELALCAYNAGIGNVDSWIEKGIIKTDGSDIENIPFKETNNYVRKIVRDYEIYKKLYTK